MDKTFKILAIDGGGIRGVFAAQILKRIREEFNITFCNEFDIITGTSTGSIIAAGLAIDYPIEKIVDLYKTEGLRIFKPNYSNSFNWYNWKAFFKNKYDSGYLKKVLDRIFQQVDFSHVKMKLIIPASDVSNGNVFVFKSNYDPSFVRDKDIRLADAILASCSAPVYFKPSRVKEYLLADGGLWANNPSLVALTEAMSIRFNKNKEDIKILSLGTGLGKKYYDLNDSHKSWGLKRWGTGLINTTMNLQSINVDNIVRFILGHEDHFLRINFETDCETALDDVNAVDSLISRADEKFTYSSKKIEKFFKGGN